MGELFPKNTIFSLVISAILLVTGSCVMEPVDLGIFLENEIIEEIIEKGRGRVTLTPDSDTGLVAGNSKVSNLTAGKYYKIERQNPDLTSYTFLGFVNSSGAFSPTMTSIGRITSITEITGLTNDVVYRVVSAKPTDKTINYTPSAGSSGSKEPVNGVINISPPSDVTYTIEFPEDYEDYQKVKVSPPAPNSSINDATDILISVSQSADIIFYDEESTDFWFLRIVIGAPPSISITLTPYALPAQVPINITNVNINISDFEGHICEAPECANPENHTRTIIIGNATTLSSTYGINSFNWYHGDTPITTSMAGFSGAGSSQLTIDFTGDYLYTEQLNREGVHIYSVTAQDSSGRPWSAIFSITVTNN